MGFLNPRAKCPNCRNKIRTYHDYSVTGTKDQPWGRLSATRTVNQCHHCGVLLTGRERYGFGEIDVAGTERLVQEQQQAETGGGGRADELAKLAQLRDSGVLSDQEFAAEKARLLAGS